MGSPYQLCIAPYQSLRSEAVLCYKGANLGVHSCPPSYFADLFEGKYDVSEQCLSGRIPGQTRADKTLEI